MSLTLALRMVLMANAAFPDRIRLWSLTCDVPRDRNLQHRNLQQRLRDGRQTSLCLEPGFSKQKYLLLEALNNCRTGLHQSCLHPLPA